MGRWTPLILMAGGLAILLGTLVGISFPMGGQNANVPQTNRRSEVLPANINVNSTGAGNAPAQRSNNNDVAQNNDSPNPQDNTPEATPTETPSTDTNQNTNQPNDPIPALW